MRLIDADALFDKIYTAFGTTIDESEANVFMGHINDAPTVEAAPVVHGKWSDSYRSGYKPPRGTVCGECDCWNERTSLYCPNCAAKMDL